MEVAALENQKCILSSVPEISILKEMIQVMPGDRAVRATAMILEIAETA